MFNHLLRWGLLFPLGLFACAAGAAGPAAKKITYDDHIRPIFRQYCLKCHDAATKKSDLALDAYATAMEGGASGEVIYPADLDSSRLWLMVNHEDEPSMPPNADKLPADKLTLIRTWIEGGALENSGSVAKAKKPNGLAMRAPAVSGKPAGPAAMPESIFRQPVVVSGRPAATAALAASPWAPLVVVAGQHQVSLYHSESAQLLGVLPFPEGIPQVLKFSRDGSLLLTAGGRGAALGLAALVDVRTGSRLVTVGDEYDEVEAADLSPNQALIALGGPTKVVRVYNTADRSLAYEIHKHTDWITAIAFSPDGQLLVTADRGGGAYLWEAETGREVATLRGHPSEVTDACWRADSQIVATSGVDGTIRLWNREEGKQVKSWTAHGGGTTAIAFAADGRLVSTGRDRVVKLWRPDGGHLKDLTTFADIGLAVCISHDGHRVAAGDYTGEVRLLEVDSGKQVGRLAANPPTLAMRVTAAAGQVASAQSELKTAAAAKLAADKRLAEAKTEAGRRSAALAETQQKLAASQAARDAMVQEVAARKEAIGAETEKVKQATIRLAQATTTVQAAEAALATAAGDGADKFTAATEGARQALAGVEAAHALLKRAIAAGAEAEKKLAAGNQQVESAQQAVKAAQVAVDRFARPLATVTAEVAAANRQATTRQAAMAAANTALQAAQAEQAAFAQADETLAKAIQKTVRQAEAQAQQLAKAKSLQKKLAAELATRQAAAQAAKKQLAEAKKRLEQIQTAVQATATTAGEQAHSTAALAVAQQKAEAAAAQAQADAEMFHKAQEVRAAYQKK